MGIRSRRSGRNGQSSKGSPAKTMTVDDVKPSTETTEQSAHGSAVTNNLGWILLLLAFLCRVVWDHVDSRGFHSDRDQTVKDMLDDFCCQVHCHPSLEPFRRTQRASGMIPMGTKLMEIPRKFQFREIDALRDDFIRRLPPGLTPTAYLAVYLAQLRSNSTRLNSVLQHYLLSLPTYQDFAEFHPLLWSDQELEVLLNTSAYDQVMAYRRQVENEYQALQQSPVFRATIARELYYEARLRVMTRAFGTRQMTEDMFSPEDRRLYGELQVDLTNGSYIMVPVLDSYDHHGQPNVEFYYDAGKDSFVLSATETIAKGQQLFDTYGRLTDGNLFARYGFVNGDGCDHTDASITVFHSIDSRPNDSWLQEQQQQLLRYLQYDDGYGRCVNRHQGEAWDLKKFKYLYIHERANLLNHWVAVFGPRDKAARPPLRDGMDSRERSPPPELDLRDVSFNTAGHFSTCRVLSLTEVDYGGTATALLREQWMNTSFVFPPTDDALEFRTLSCMVRLTSMAIESLGNMEETKRTIASLTPSSREWTVANIRFGEMQSLHALRDIAMFQLQPFVHIFDASPPFYMRESPCPYQWLQDLFTDVQQIDYD